LDKFSNRDLQRIAGLTHRQVIYLTEKGIVPPSLEEASGKGSTRWYSRRDMGKLLLAKALRDAGLDFPALKVVTTVVSAFFDELDKILATQATAVLSVPSVLHLIDGRYGFLSTEDGKRATPVFEVAKDGRARAAAKSVAEVMKQRRVHVEADLAKIVEKLKGE